MDKKTLTNHEKIHTGNKAFKCPECWYETHRKDKYNIHMKKRHGDNPTAKRKMPVPRQMRKQLEEQGWIPKSESSVGTGNVMNMEVTLPSHVMTGLNIAAEHAFTTGMDSYVQFLQ